MEIKNDVQSKITLEPVNKDKKGSEKPSEKTGNSSLVSTDDVKISVNSQQKERSEKIAQTNQAITSLTTTKETTDKLAEVVRSIAGIAELATTKKSPSEKSVLQSEIKQLANEVVSIANSLRLTQVSTVPEEAAKIAIEQKLAQALEVLLPEPPRGPDDFNITTKEAIIQTRTVVAKSQARIEVLRESLKLALDKASSYVTAQRESKEDKLSTNDADSAFKLSQDIGQTIKDFPVKATSALGSIELYSGNV